MQQDGNPNYESPIVGTQRIIFDFEIINNLDKSNIGTILTIKSIYRMILTIDKSNNIIAGNLELTHFKQYWNGYDYNRLFAILTKIKKITNKKIKLNFKIIIFKNFNCFLSINNQVSQEV